MKLTRRPRRTPVPALLALLLPLAACGMDGGSTVEASAPASSTPEEGVPAEALSGFVRLAESSREKAVFLTFHDVDDGVQKLLIDLTELTARSENYLFFLDTANFAFSADFHRAAYRTSNGEIRVAELDPDALSYRVTATLAPEEESTLEGGEISYQTPQFSPDGAELWFEEHHEHGEEDSRVLAVPSADPSEGGPEERGHVPPDAWALHEYEGSVLTKGTENVFAPEAAYAVTPDNELQVLTESDGAAGGEFHLLTDGTRVASRDFLRGPSGGFVGPLPKTDWGVTTTDRSTLYTFDLSPDGTVSEEEVLVENPHENIQRLWVDTDGGRYVMYTNSTYYGLAFDAPGSEPKELFSDFTTEGPLATSTSSAETLGVFPAQD